jgi:hypothetical protein
LAPPCFCSFATSRSLLDNFTLKILAAQYFFLSDGGIAGLAKRLLLFPAQRVTSH